MTREVSFLRLKWLIMKSGKLKSKVVEKTAFYQIFCGEDRKNQRIQYWVKKIHPQLTHGRVLTRPRKRTKAHEGEDFREPEEGYKVRVRVNELVEPVLVL